MRALNLHKIDDLRCEDVPVPVPGADEVLLKVLAAGICGSDVPRVFTKGTYHFPTIIGHEFAGEIVKAGADEYKDLIGKKATVFPLLPCFSCDACQDENYASCKNYDYYGSRRDGGFAEYIAVKVWNLVMVPGDIPIEWAAMTEPSAVAIHALEGAAVRRGDNVCIFGCGAIGLIIARLARSKEAEKVILLDIDQEKLAFACSLGFEHTLNSRDDDFIDQIMMLTDGKGADVCIDAAGVPQTIAGCLNAAGNSAHVVLMGNPSGDILLKQNDYWQILRKQLTLTGTWNSDYGDRKNDWKAALHCMESGVIDLTGFITHVFPLEEAGAAFGLLRDRNEFCVKVMFSPHELAG